MNIIKVSEVSNENYDFSMIMTLSCCIIVDGTRVLDSGAMYHIFPRRDWFSSFEELDEEILIVNNDTCTVIGIGIVRIKMLKELKEIRCVFDVKNNLILL